MFAANKLWRHRIHSILFCVFCLLVPGSRINPPPMQTSFEQNPRSSGEDGVYFRLRSGTVRLETTAFRNESGLSLTALDPEEFISN